MAGKRKVKRAFLFNPKVIKGKVKSIELPSKEAGEIDDILNRGLLERLKAMAGEQGELLERALKEKVIDYKEVAELEVLEYLEERILKEQKGLDREEQDALKSRFSKIGKSRIKDILQLDSPLKENPFLGRELRKVQTEEFARLAAIDEKSIKKLLEHDFNWDEMNEAALSSMLKDGIIDERQMDELISLGSLTRLTGDNLELIKALKMEGRDTFSEIIGWELDDWIRLIEKSDIPLPGGESSSSYGENMRANLEKSYPSQYFMRHLLKDGYEEELKALDFVERLPKGDKKLEIIRGTVVNPELSKIKGIDTRALKRAGQELAALSAFANRYRYLKVTEIINDPALGRDKKRALITGRVDALKRFLENNPHLDLERSDLLGKIESFDWKDVESANRKYIKGQLLAYQRIKMMGADFETGKILLSKGLDSAKAVVDMSEEQFINMTGLDYVQGRLVYLKARESALRSSHLFELLRDAMFGSFNLLAVSNQGSIVNNLKEIDGFETLFGSQNYCDCKDCRSIFSPAAYFTDLMYFIQENISKKLFEPGREEHPLYLKNRRPDLWELKLSCKNTTGEIPYLEVVNSVLTSFISRAEGENDVFKKISQSNLSTSLPVNLPLEELRLYISHFETSLYEIFKNLREPRKTQLRERLRISGEELNNIITTDLAGTRGRFGNLPLADMEVESFLEYAKISREELDQLLKTGFSDLIGAIEVKLLKEPEDIQKYREVIKGLTEEGLDYIYRYLKLWKKTEWSIPEYELLLNSLKSAGLLTELGDEDEEGCPALLELAKLAIFQDELGLGVEELAALVYELPLSSIKEGKKSLAERLFDLEKIFGVTATAADGTKSYKSSFTIPANKEEDNITPLLLAGLGISQADLSLLLSHLEIDIQLDQILSRSELSTLFRYSRLAHSFKWTIEELLGALELVIDTGSIKGLADIDRLVEFNNWLKRTAFKIEDLSFILKGKESGERRYEANNDESAGMVLKVLERGEIDKRELLYYYLGLKLGLTHEELHREFRLKLAEIDSHPELKEQIRELFSAEGSEPAGFDDPQLLLGGLEELALPLKGHYLLSLTIQESYNIPSEQLNRDILPHLLENDFYGAEIAALLRRERFNEQLEPLNLADFTPLTSLLKELEELSLLLKKLDLSAGGLTFLVENREIFGIENLKTLTLEDIREIDFYRELTARLEREEELDIQAALKLYQSSGTFHESIYKTFSRSWKSPEGRISSLSKAFSYSGITLQRFRYLKELNSLSTKLGLDGDNLIKLKSTGYDELTIARDAALGAFSAKYPDEEEKRSKLEPYLDRVNSIKRDLLCEYIIAMKETFKFKERSELYSYFLLDVEMSGCFRTSWIVAAISSLQLYIHRCLNNLEQSEPYLNPLFEEVRVNPAWIPQDEWEWRKNYRVWEANRKVFLYPENYLEPALRDNKTHLFKELEDELLQEKITMESAEGAYKKYLAQFSELTKLRFSGAYYNSIVEDYLYYSYENDKGLGYIPVTGIFFPQESEESEYYLFARTNVDPYRYYYRTYNHYKQVWGNWVPMKLAIEAAEISPLIFRGKLYIFWSEVQAKELSSVKAGSSTSNGTLFKVHSKYSFLDEKGSWSSPQRVYAGFTHSSEEEVFNRVQGYYDEDEKVRERKHDHIYEEYRRRVFRKPYSAIKGDSKSTPVTLSFIWSKEQGREQVIYYINAQVITLAIILGFVKLQLSIPRVEFHLESGQLGRVSYQQEVDILVKMFGDTFAKVKMTARMIPLNSSTCIIRVKGKVNVNKLGIRINTTLDEKISVTLHSTPVLDNIFASRFNLSLAKSLVENSSNEDIMSDADNISEPSVKYLINEYNYGFIEDGSFNHYIESGSTGFTSVNRKINQTGSGEAFLTLPANASGLELVQLTTILTDELQDILYTKGLEEFLSIRTQMLTNNSGLQFDMKGAYGEYYWELFFHIPFLIADHLNANRKYKEAKWWYERIFNPTAEEAEAEGADSNWQFREFKKLTIERLKDIMVNSEAIERYKREPFSPHAIAKLRANAYQKAVVMKYIDNLLDWGDHLFSQDTRESINEALMLYLLASDILGKRPVKLGKCETLNEHSLTYDTIKESIKEGSEFLITLENSYLTMKVEDSEEIAPEKASKFLGTILENNDLEKSYHMLESLAMAAAKKGISDQFDDIFVPPLTAIRGGRRERRGPESGGLKVAAYTQFNMFKMEMEEKISWKDYDKLPFDKFFEHKPGRYPHFELVKESPLVFCIPNNKDLLEYWDRVEDRLYKIRHCMNISGVRRSLALFQPPIDPALMVRARAAGLSLEDIMAMLSTPVNSPYRFSYLIEKARQFTQTVRSFGSTLLSALEKKDVEELTLLRSVHEQNILKLTGRVRKEQLEQATRLYKAMSETVKSVEERISYYQGLVDEGLTAWERTQQISRHTATALRSISSIFYSASGITKLLPQLGSPFAMKWGGVELGGSTDEWGKFMNTLASIALDVAASAGLEAGFQRREQEWKQQLKLASQEKKQVDQQLLASEIAQSIAGRELEIHERSVEQTKELYSFYKDKFTALGLYNFLSSNLNRIYREAYNIALNMARAAERAYQFELNDRESFFIAADNWESDHAGLLSGDRLLLQLQQLEQAYMRGNVRRPEIQQSFSLALLDPEQLLTLRQTGSCEINIPEIAFELFYPGQYRRLIKAVAVTIPSITGPYTNISAKLTLMEGKIRESAGGDLVSCPVAVNSSINLSGARNDSGMFNLNLRDERYLPFEGGGAVSKWQLQLPSKVRTFNYDTISDVLLTISYTALEGDRETAEISLEADLKQHALDSGLYRLISLRHEFSQAYHKLLNSPADEAQLTSFELREQHFPHFLKDETLRTDEVIIYLKPQKREPVTPPSSFTIAGRPVESWTFEQPINGPVGGEEELKVGKMHGGTADLKINPLKIWEISIEGERLIKDELDDIFILIKYRIHETT